MPGSELASVSRRSPFVRGRSTMAPLAVSISSNRLPPDSPRLRTSLAGSVICPLLETVVVVIFKGYQGNRQRCLVRDVVVRDQQRAGTSG